jgi:voltage-gated potassium channel
VSESESEIPRQEVERERWEVLHQLEEWLETPMVVLGFVWLVLLVVELTRGLTAYLETVGTAIWIVFVLDFLLRFTLAPRKLAYLKHNVLTLVALVLPAFRVLRAARLFRVLRGLRLVRVITSLNRGMRALGRAMGRRGFGYVVALTSLVTVAGSAGIYAFERGAVPDGGIQDVGDAVWWTSMLMTTMGSEYWPQTPEGRILGFVLSLYAFAVFGYVTATLASFFVGRDAENAEAEVAGEVSLRALREEIAALREEVRTLGGRAP